MNRLCILVLLSISLAGWAHAAVPGQVNYQGLLLDDLGAPGTAAVAMDFALFDSEVSGLSLWKESHPAVQVVDGVYQVALGSVTPLTPQVVSGGTLYLEDRVLEREL
jgi:hypothetical protein